MTTIDYSTYIRAFAEQHRGSAEQLRGTLEFARAHGHSDAFESAALLAHRLHGTARMLGLVSLGRLAGALERSIDCLRRRADELAETEWQLLLAAADELGRLMLDLREREHEGTPSRELLSALENVVGV